MDEFARPQRQYRLTSAEILYNPPNQPHVVECFIWQDYDRAPEYPELRKFLAFWMSRMEGTLHSVRVSEYDTPRPPGLVYAAYSTAVH